MPGAGCQDCLRLGMNAAHSFLALAAQSSFDE